MTLIIRNRKITRRVFSQKGSMAVAGGMLAPLAVNGSEIDTPVVNGTVQSSTERLAMYQEESARGVVCRLCPNECTLEEGEVSVCRNRVVRKSKLYTKAFGNPCAVHTDPVEKKPLYHFLPGSSAFSIATAGCNFACLNCQNWTISQTSPDKTQNYDLPPGDVVASAKANKCRSIAYTYSEPVTFYEYVYETSKIARKEGIMNIMVSNGYINPAPLKELCRYIDGANINLKSFSNTTYVKLNGGTLQPVLDSLKIYRDEGVWLEITNLVIPGYNDNPDEIRLMCRWLFSNGFADTPLHFNRFQPLYKLEHLPPTPLAVLNRAAGIAREAGIHYVYVGNVPGSGTDDTLCPDCGQKAVERTGFSVISNKITGGRCTCGAAIPGRWS